MSFLEKNRYLLAPPYSERVETFICPIAKSNFEISDGLSVAGGWRFFNQLRVIQKKNNIYSEVIMSPSRLITLSKAHSKKTLLKAEEQIHQITKNRLSFSRIDVSRPHIMGVINLTPDSFYKNSQLNNPSSIVKKVIKMMSDGASIIDIGGESTRPGAKKISVGEEMNRVTQSISVLKKYNFPVKISLDTRNIITMKKGLENGVDIINDVSGFKEENKIKFASNLKLPMIVMHMQKEPQNMQIDPNYSFAPVDIYKDLSNRIDKLLQMGIDKSNIVVDPGIGFGKNIHHNLDILRNMTLFHSLGVAILLGVSRKTLISELTIKGYKNEGINKRSVNPTKRLSGSIAFAMHAYNNGIQFIRTHDVFETKQAIICQEAMN